MSSSEATHSRSSNLNKTRIDSMPPYAKRWRPLWLLVNGPSRGPSRLLRGLRCRPTYASKRPGARGTGSISGDHIDKVISVLTPRTEEAFERDEEVLVQAAQSLEFRHFVNVMD